MTEQRQATSDRHWISGLRLRLWWLVAVSLLLVALYVIVIRQLMVLVPELREPAAAWLSERLDMPVEIGELTGHVDGVSPVFVFTDLRLDAGQDSSPLRIREVALTLDVLPTLIHRAPRLRQLLVRGLDLHLVRREGEPVRLKGRDLPAGGGDGVALRDILEPVYRHRRLVLQDVAAIIDLHGMERIETRDLHLALINSGTRHRLALRFSLLDQPLSVDARLEMQGDAFSLDELNGRGYLALRGEGLEHWLPEGLELPLRPRQASGDVSLWTRIKGGQLQRAHLSLATRDLRLAEAGGDGEWSLAALKTRARLDRVGQGMQLTVAGVEAATKTGDLRIGPVAGYWHREQDVYHWRFGASDIDLTALREQFQAWPFPMNDAFEEVREQLDLREPGGRLAMIYVTGENQHVTGLGARLDNVSLAAGGDRPGFRRLSGWLQGAPEQGVLVLDSPALQVQLPDLFSQPLAAAISGAARWRWREDEAFRLDTGRLRLENEDAGGEALLTLSGTPGEVPRLSLRAALYDGVVANAARYIPVERERFRPALKDWLNGAFLGGHLESARFLHEGPVKIDPLRQQDRTLQMAFRVRDSRLHFQDGWPPLEEVSGRVLFDGRDILGRDLQARWLDSRLTGASFDIPEAPPQGGPYLYVSGQLGATFTDLGYAFQETPLAAVLPAGFADWRFSAGSLDGHLLLGLPLGENAGEPRVITTARITGADLQAPDRGLRLSGLSGDARFSLADGLSASRITGEFQGHPASASVTSDATATHLDLDGGISMDTLSGWLDWRWLGRAEGALDYRGRLSLSRDGGPARLEVDTDLRGVALDAPAPLGKRRDAVAPLHMDMQMDNGRQQLQFAYRDTLAGDIRLGDAVPFSGRVTLGTTDAEPATDPGLLVDGWTGEINMPAWLDFFAADAVADGVQDETFDVRVVLDTDRLRLWNLLAEQARLSAASSLAGWQLAVDSPAVVASLNLPPGYQPRGDLPMDLDISRLHMPVEEGRELSGEDLFDPMIIPVADVRVSDLRIGERDYGSWQAQMRPLAQGLRMEALKGDWRKARISGRLDWTAGENGQQSHFVGDVRSRDLGATLKAWDMAAFIESSDARSSYDVVWQGSPLDFDYMGLNGSGAVDVREGLLPGRDRRTSALRLLGVVNIGNINRRLRLDFSDLWRQGLVVDRIIGNFTINGPEIDTGNLRIRSPAAEFRINGQVNVAEQTLNHEMEMTLPLSSNLYAGCLAGPAACAGIFVVERLWGDRLEKMTTVSYRVRGDWDDPKVEEVSRQARD